MNLEHGDTMILYYCPMDENWDYIIEDTIYTVKITASINPDEQITLKKGWNFVSVPQTLANGADTAGVVFSGIDTDKNSVLGYNAETQKWENLGSSSQLKPLAAYWIYSKTADEIDLFYEETEATDLPTSLKVYEGWNAVGVSANKEITAEKFLSPLREKWAALYPWNLETGDFGTTILPGSATGFTMAEGSGNWLYVTENGGAVLELKV